MWQARKWRLEYRRNNLIGCSGCEYGGGGIIA
jgi:hypothetical protein